MDDPSGIGLALRCSCRHAPTPAHLRKWGGTSAHDDMYHWQLVVLPADARHTEGHPPDMELNLWCGGCRRDFDETAQGYSTDEFIADFHIWMRCALAPRIASMQVQRLSIRTRQLWGQVRILWPLARTTPALAET